MASYVTPKYGTQFIMYVGLESVATAGAFQSNPTLASGDFKVSIDGGALTNLTTLPTVTPASGKGVKIILSASEMTGDNITVVCSDASGGEWKDLIINIQTTARQIDDLAYPTTSGRSIDVTTTGEVGIDWANVGSPTTTLNLSGTTVSTVSGTVGSVTGNVGGNVVGSVASVSGGVTVTTNNDKTGYGLSSAAVQAIWDALTSALTTVNSIGKFLKDQLDVTVGSRLAAASYSAPPSASAIRTEIDSNSTQLAKLGTPAGASVSADIAAVKSDSAAILSDTGTDGVVLSTAQMQSLADIVLGRSVSNIDSTASTHSLYELIEAILESNTSSGSWVIYKTNGSTTFNTRTLATDANAAPIVGVS